MRRSPFTWHIRRWRPEIQYSRAKTQNPSQRWDPAHKILKHSSLETRDQSQRWNLVPETLKLQPGTKNSEGTSEF